MAPHPSYHCGYHPDHIRERYDRYLPSPAARRGFQHFGRKSDSVHPYTTPPPPVSSPSCPPHIGDFRGITVRSSVDRPFSNISNGAAPYRRNRGSSSSSSSCSLQPPSPPKHPQLVKTSLCDFWKRGEVCRFGPHCWFAHGPLQLRTANENCSTANDFANQPNAQGVGSSVSQFTPEQQHWMFLSQQTHNVFPFAQNLLATRFQDAINVRAAHISAVMCDEIEREHIRPGGCAPSLRVSGQEVPPTSRKDCPSQSGSPVPTFITSWLSSVFDEAVSEKEARSNSSPVNNSDQISTSSDDADYHEKEECPLYKYGCCPFEVCFFEHLENHVK